MLVCLVDGLWVLVTESGAKAISQTYVVAGEFPDQKIKSYWNEGYRVRSVCCGQGSWAIIFEKVCFVCLFFLGVFSLVSLLKI